MYGKEKNGNGLRYIGSLKSSVSFKHHENGQGYNKDDYFDFKVPPEAPIFLPTEEEFSDPLAYISKIRPIAENTGICKIRPPPNWQPPFAVDVDKLKFTPRIQRLNELEAKTRVKLNFLDQIAKFWELQGSALKIPMVEKRALDLYSLYRVVQHEGGFESASKDRKWAKIAIRLGYPAGKSTGTILKTHYEKLLYPFDVFKHGKTEVIKLDDSGNSETSLEIDCQENKDELNKSLECKKENDSTDEMKSEDLNTDKDYKSHDFANRAANFKTSLKVSRRSKRFEQEPKTEIKDESDSEKNKELKRLQFYGPGPKMAGFNEKKKEENKKPKTTKNEHDPLAKYVCHNCRRGDSEECMLLCDGCDDSYHTFCLVPPLIDVPKGDWRCPKCVAEEVSKPLEAFGFEQAQREYTLQQFGEMADQFKSEYFNMPVHMVPLTVVEREFWRIVSSIDEDVTVEYGADLHTMDHGSGFPTKTSLNLFPGDKEYADSSWNLNNLPVLEGSVLGYINADISGMKVPWMYVGMCFATFCWHNEDHWSYSINYLHWGEAKTWYGVPGSKAETFEETMRSAAPELFHSQPDLLHQLVTIMNPNILMNAGVPVYRTDQNAGEFVVTFPRAYHAGFNQGYNFAEAVNFAPADWLRMGRECILHYSHLRRFCVFSHDELVCKMALDPERLDITIAAATYQDMLHMVDNEKKLRKILLEWGVTSAEREAFELLPDDERQCDICKTTCFLSAVTCSCTGVLVCLRHYKDLCKCKPEAHTLRYRYTLDELPVMLKTLKLKAESFDNWVSRVKDALDPNTPKNLNLSELKALFHEADGKKFPKSDLMQTLKLAVEDAEKCASVIQQLDVNKIRTRTRHSTDTKYKLTLEELTLFCEEIDSLACILEEAKSIKELLRQTQGFESESQFLLSLKLTDCVLEDLESCINHGHSLCIDLPNLKRLSTRLKQVQWLKDVISYKKRVEVLGIESIKKLIETGVQLPPNPEMMEELSNLQGILEASEDWERKAQALLKDKSGEILIQVDKLLAKAAKINAYLPTEEFLFEAINKARDWLRMQEEMNSAEYYPYFKDMEELVKKGKSLSLHLVEVTRLEGYLDSASIWKEKTSRAFLRKNSVTTLMEALSPKMSLTGYTKNKKKQEESFFNLCESSDPTSVVNAFKEAEEREMEHMKSLRAENLLKSMDPNDCASFCVCQRGVFGLMMQCELCKDWYHSVCVQLPKVATSTVKGNFCTVAMHYGFKDSKFLCPNCFRTKRPRLDVILNLLMSLQKLYCRLPEGEALQCLTERAMNWQDRARQLLLNPELETARKKLTAFSQKYVTETALLKTVEGKSTKKIRGNEVFSDPLFQDSDDSKECTSTADDPMDDHAYSLHLPKLDDGEYRIHISFDIKRQLEDLLMEGDLLEVHLDETFQLWKLLLATRDHNRESMLIDFDAQSRSTPIKRGRKRRSEESEAARKVRQVKADKAEAEKKGKAGRKPKENKEKEKKTMTKRKRGRRRASTGSRDDDDDEACAANACLKPLGENVDWVQCDGGCELWFHMACVGLVAQDINEDEDYICIICSQGTDFQALRVESRSSSPVSPDSTQLTSSSRETL